MAEALSDVPQQGPGRQSPADFHPLAEVRAASPEQVQAAVRAARAAQPAWAALQPRAREQAVLRLCRALLERRAEGVQVLVDETGRGPTECLMSELVGVVEIGRAAVRASRRALATEKIGLSRLDYPGKRAFIEALPRGVIGVIAPWNYPVGIFLKSLLPALLAGNGVVLKPSEHTPRSGQWLANVCNDVLPNGLVQAVQGDGKTGAALVEAGIDGLVFTGSVPSGRRVAAKAGELLIPCSTELGGKDAAIVLADCDLERTVAGIAQWGFHNAGQNCAAIERVYVEQPIADAFVARLTAVTKKLRVAPGTGPTDLGPMQNAAQLRIVEDHVQDALALGARLLAGGARTGPGLGYQPTLLDGCTPAMKVIRDETFGPLLAIVRVADAEEGLRLANDSRYGLNGSVWTRDLARGEALARRLEVGVALVNNHALTGIFAELPWTGVKESGPGVASSRHAYATFTRRRAVLVDGSQKPDPWWMPGNADLAAFGEALVQRQLGGGVGTLLKLGGLLGKRVKAIRDLVSVALLLALLACGRSPTIVNHDPGSPEITGLVRLVDQGGYAAGQTERLRAIYSVDGTAVLHFTASGGKLVQSGDEVAWTLPDESAATLTLAIDSPRHTASATFRFALSGSGKPGALIQAAAAGAVDGSGDETGSVCSLKLDSAGNPVIIYRNDVHPGLWYATWSGTAWQTQLVDGMGFEVGGPVAQGMSLVLAPDNTPHIAYLLENSQLWYATRTAGSWVRERVDAPAVPHYQYNYNTSIALDPAHGGRPTVMYGAVFNGSYEQVALAVRGAPGVWGQVSLGITTPSPNPFNHWTGGMGITPAGVIYFGFHNDYQAAAGHRVGRFSGTGTTATYADYPAGQSAALLDTLYQNAPLALDASSRPLLAYGNTVEHVQSGTTLADATLTNSPFEETVLQARDLTFAQGKPYLAIGHQGLEFVTTNAAGYWLYTSAGTLDTAGALTRLSVAVDAAGAPHACFKRGGKITFQ